MQVSGHTKTPDRSSAGWLLAIFLSCLLFSYGSLSASTPDSARSIQFNRDIRPILSDACFHCHGFDAAQRKANRRLDTFEGATAVQKGVQAIKPGDLAGSDLWRRINSKEPAEQMPLPSSGKTITPAQIAVLMQWIEQGASYQKHWAFEPPKHVDPPVVKNTNWPKNPIDNFILARLEANGLQPSSPARLETLARRLTLDLTGLPPTPEQLDGFLSDTSPGAIDRLIDRLLASPRYGEHMARYWLDLARYGDTHGLHLDNERSIWPYRDWVVDAFNRNLPFDQFTIEQLAGDLLPNATREQKIASGFNRCNLSTSEGGAIDEEFRVRYAVDRTETVSTAWLGLTMGCAVCHDHKLDPISQKEFYQMSSLFNNISENAMDGNALFPPPTLRLPTLEQEQKLAEYGLQVTNLDKKLCEAVAALHYTDPAASTNASPPTPKEIVWVDDDLPTNASVMLTDGHSNRWITASEGPVYSGQRAIQRTGTNIHQVFFDVSTNALKVGAGDKLFAYVFLDPSNPPKAIMLQFHVGGKWSKRANWGDEELINFGKKGSTEKLQMGKLPEAGKWVRLEVPVARLGLRPETQTSGFAFTQYGGNAYWDKAGLVSVNDPAQHPALSLTAWRRFERGLVGESTLPDEVKNIIKKESAKFTEAEKQKLRDYFLQNVYAEVGSEFLKTRTELKNWREKYQAVDREVVATMISKELEKPRPAWVLIRGQYDKHGEPVGPGVPSILPPMPKCDVTNRLTFARWLVDTNNPLTARVTVNRFWQQFFGTGLVKTSEDFGNKGEWPSHPELLDWLATEFMQSGWDVKRLVRLILSSATYQQDSKVTPKLYVLDPENRLLTRGPRYRLDAEVLRDSALYVAGLLNLKSGGRGVRPYQPPGIWEAVGYTTSNTAKYSQDHGEALYRRSLYIFWKRTAPPPSMTTFDAPSRESCTPRRERTNTPLQALVTLNDPQYFEAARHLGYRIIRASGETDLARLRFGFRLVTGRWPSELEATLLSQALQTQREHFSANPEAAKKAISVGESPVPADVPPAELAAHTLVASMLLNLDEVVTKN